MFLALSLVVLAVVIICLAFWAELDSLKEDLEDLEHLLDRLAEALSDEETDES